MSSEPNAVSNAVAQVNTQGVYSTSQYHAFTPAGGDAPDVHAQTYSTVGFAAKGGIDACNGSAPYNKQDAADGQNLEQGPDASISILEVGSSTVVESPYVRYVKLQLSDGKEQPTQTYKKYNETGRCINKSKIRNGCYWSENEADIFTLGLSKTSEEYSEEDLVKMHDPEHRDV